MAEQMAVNHRVRGSSPCWGAKKLLRPNLITDWAFLLENVEMFWIYILKSESTDKLYIGQTANLEERLQRHNSNKVGKLRYTHKQKGPWKLIYSEQYNMRSDAMRRERFLKSGQGREWIHNNIIS